MATESETTEEITSSVPEAMASMVNALNALDAAQQHPEDHAAFLAAVDQSVKTLFRSVFALGHQLDDIAASVDTNQALLILLARQQLPGLSKDELVARAIEVLRADVQAARAERRKAHDNGD